MNTHTFDNHSVTCPICQRTGNLKPVRICSGLFTCPYCQERLVVAESGHYVRDPYICRQMKIAASLRRQSQPWARIVRDFGAIKRPSVLLALGTALLFGAAAITLTNLNNSVKPSSEGIPQQVKPIIDHPR